MISYNIYQTLKLLITHAVLTLATLDQMAYKSHHQLQYWSNPNTTSNSCCINLGHTRSDGVQLNLTVNVFIKKVLIVGTIFTSPTGYRTAILRGHPSHAKTVQPLGVQRDYLHFSVVSNGPAPRIEPATSRSAVMRSTDWANPVCSVWDSKQCKNFQNTRVPAAWCSQIKHYTAVLSHPFRPRSYEEKLSRKRGSPSSWVNGKNSWPLCPSQLYWHMLRLSRLN